MILIYTYGKFDTASRKVANVLVSGNSVYVTEEAFKTYANYKCFWVFSNDEGDGNTNGLKNETSNADVSTVSFLRYVATQGQTRKIKACYLYSNSNLTGTKYTYKANTTVTILENVSSNIDKVRVNATGRVAYINISNYTNSTSSNIVQNNTVGKYYRLKSITRLYANSNMSGTYYTYLDQTQVRVLKNISSTIDYVQVVKTR